MINKKLGIVIIVPFIVRCILACSTELNNDEVYYWTYAKKLQWNYFDHPPGIAVLLKIFTANLLLQQEFFLRLGSIVCCAISTWLLYCIGKKIKNEHAGLVAAVLFTASPYCSIIAGWMVIPDAPQLAFWLASVLLMLKITGTSERSYNTGQQLLLLGVTTGCCILCKVHGIFLWVGFLFYIIFFQRRLLRNPFLFCSAFICAVIVSPVFFWNLSNDFISYRYHSARVSFFSEVSPDSFFRELSGEALYNNPVIFIIVIVAIIALVKKKCFAAIQHQRLLLCIALPMILLVLFMAVFRDTLPHWTGPAYATLLPIAAAYLVFRQKEDINWTMPRPAKWAMGVTIVLLLAAIVMVKAFPRNIGDKDRLHLGDGDPMLDMSGFKQFGQQFNSLYQQDLREQKIGSNPFLLSDFWFPAAHIDYYAARPAHLPMLVFGDLAAIHHYAWLNASQPFFQIGGDAYFITISNHFHPVPDRLLGSFEKVLDPVVITQYRAGTAVRHFFIYRLIHYKGHLPANGVIG